MARILFRGPQYITPHINFDRVETSSAGHNSYANSTYSSIIRNCARQCPLQYVAANASWDVKRNLNDIPLQIPGFWVCWRGFVPLVQQHLRSPNKIYIQVPKTHGYLLQKTRSHSVDSLGRYSRDIRNLSQIFCITVTLATIVQAGIN